MTDDLLLTGATGFVGMELLARLLDEGDRRIVALVRAADDSAAKARLQGVLENLFGARAQGHRCRVEAVAGDLTAPGLGLSPARREQLATRVGTIVHSGASVSFSQSLPQARQVNLQGTRRVLKFAELAHAAGGVERYVHVSTAYVAGTHQGPFREEHSDVGQCFNNSYERSKFEAEALVRSSPLPYVIVRPSIVVGDRHSGWTAAFNVLYWPLRALSRGLVDAVPASASAPVDVVSVDYVADAVQELLRSGQVRTTYHLTAGTKASSIGEIAGLASRYFRKAPPKLLSPADFAALQAGAARSGSERLRVYFPYFSTGAVFDDTRARARLGPRGIEVSPLADYLERLLDFATRSRWGKSPIARVQALID